MNPEFSDFLIVGGGIAGAALGARLARHGRVRVLEMENQPGYHSTGRSAAVFSESYGNSMVQALTRASRNFFYHPPAGFAVIPLVKPRSVLLPIRAAQEGAPLEAFLREHGRAAGFERISSQQAHALCPILRTEDLIGALLTHSVADIEVHEFHQGYLRQLKAAGGSLVMGCRVSGLKRDNDGLWSVATTVGEFQSRIVVNAAGAWAGEIAALAGATNVGLEPLRRTAVLIEAHAQTHLQSWPMIVDIEDQFYIKPEAGMLMLSPADESPSNACDAQPDELDIAIAVDRAERATTLQIKRIVHKWAGLRTFVPDRTPVIGHDSEAPGFFWLAALGGFGIQTAPAVAELATDLLLGRQISNGLTDFGVDAAACAAARFAGAAPFSNAR